MIQLKEMLLSYSSIFIKIAITCVGIFLFISLFNKIRSNGITKRRTVKFENIITLDDITNGINKEDTVNYVSSFTPISPEEEKRYTIYI